MLRWWLLSQDVEKCKAAHPYALAPYLTHCQWVRSQGDMVACLCIASQGLGVAHVATATHAACDTESVKRLEGVVKAATLALTAVSTTAVPSAAGESEGD